MSTDKTLKVWDLETGEELNTLKGHQSVVFGVAITPEGARAVSALDDRMLKVWDLETEELLCTITCESSFYGEVVAPNGHTVVAGDVVGRVYSLRLENV